MPETSGGVIFGEVESTLRDPNQRIRVRRAHFRFRNPSSSGSLCLMSLCSPLLRPAAGGVPGAGSGPVDSTTNPAGPVQSTLFIRSQLCQPWPGDCLFNPCSNCVYSYIEFVFAYVCTCDIKCVCVFYLCLHVQYLCACSSCHCTMVQTKRMCSASQLRQCREASGRMIFVSPHASFFGEGMVCFMACSWIWHMRASADR